MRTWPKSMPGNGGQVEPIRRLVEEQDVGVPEKGLCEKHADLDPLVHVPHQLLVKGFRRAQRGKKGRRLSISLPSAQLGVLRFQLARAHAVGLGELGLSVEGFPLSPDRVQARRAHDDGVQDPDLLEGEVVLAENGHALACPEDDVPPVRFQFTGKDFEKRGLAGAVRADDAIAVAGGELEVDILEQDPIAKGESEVADGYHGSAVLSELRGVFKW
jgi:hypothetical protein